MSWLSSRGRWSLSLQKCSNTSPRLPPCGTGESCGCFCSLCNSDCKRVRAIELSTVYDSRLVCARMYHGMFLPVCARPPGVNVNPACKWILHGIQHGRLKLFMLCSGWCRTITSRATHQTQAWCAMIVCHIVCMNTVRCCVASAGVSQCLPW